MRNIFVLLFSCLFFLTGCKDNVIGTWERQGDDLQGMRVKIIKTDNSMYGEITQKSNQGSYFNMNETKWNNIKKVGKDEYEMEDLVKGYDNKYVQSHLRIKGDLLTVDWFVNDGRTTGSHQLWMINRTE